MEEKRYQVFISSTFEDLKDERQAAIKSILEMNHMPAGMELFPAADDAAWDLIKDVINDSDYYVVIVGGRYGSLDSEGLGYTEKEYDYARSIGLPVIPLLHKNPDNLPRSKTDKDENAWELLQKFRKKVEQNHTCKYWETPEDLESRLVVSLTSTIKRHPRIGWVRSDKIASKEALVKLEDAREKIALLEVKLNKQATEPPPGTEDLSSGKETITINYYTQNGWRGPKNYDKIEISWNDIFKIIGPHMMREASEGSLRGALNDYIILKNKIDFEDDDFYERIIINDENFHAVLVQLLALGLIKKSEEKHTPSDTSTYWSLTQYGEGILIKMKAIRKSNA